MKQIFFSLLLTIVLLSSGNMLAQTQKGNVMIGGDLANLSLGLNSDGNTTFSFTPKVGWFIKDGLAIGAQALFGVAHTSGSESDIINYGIGAIGRYYINDQSIEFVKRGKFFLEADLGLNGRNQTKGGGSTNGIGHGFGPGFAYFLTPNIGLEALAKYHGVAGLGSEPYQSELSILVGFQIYMPLKTLKSRAREL